MSMNPQMDEWRYKIVGNEMSSIDANTDIWKPGLALETEIIWELDVAERAIEFLRAANPKASFTLMRTRDRWEEVR